VLLKKTNAGISRSLKSQEGRGGDSLNKNNMSEEKPDEKDGEKALVSLETGLGFEVKKQDCDEKNHLPCGT